MEVCIVGSGVSGIAAAKKCVDYGFIPVVLSKDRTPGGLWNGYPGTIGVWNTMTANTSKYLFSFSDHLWPKSDPDYPSGPQVVDYFDSYIEKHDLVKYFNNDCKVTQIEKHETEYKVTWVHNSQQFDKIFKYVIIAVGRCSKEIQPFKSIGKFRGIVVKGGEYRNPSVFTGKNLVCIGRSYTSNDIAQEALTTANSVTQLFKRPYIMVEKYSQGIPTEFIFIKPEDHKKPYSMIQTPENARALFQMLLSISPDPSIYHPDWKVDIESQLPTRAIICNDNYLKSLLDKRINLIKGEVEDFYEDGVILSDGSRIQADAVLIGVGYNMRLDFLSEEIKEILRYDETNALLPMISFRQFLHPQLPNLSFAGTVHSLVPGRFELFAELAVRWFVGDLNLTEESINQGIKDEEYIKEKIKAYRTLYSYLDYFKETLKLLGLRIDNDFIENELQFKNGPMLPQFLYLDKPGMKELAREVVNEIKEKFPHVNFN